SKQSGKKAVVTKEVKLLATIGLSEDKEDACSLDDEFPPKISKKLEPIKSRLKSKHSGRWRKGKGSLLLRKRTVISDAKPLKLFAKKGNARTSGDVRSSSKKGDERKHASGKNVIKKDKAKTLSSDDESDTIKYDESLVGKKVKVWWPEDKMYYEGVIESFDAAKKSIRFHMWMEWRNVL
ncbi:armadillo-type fold protein, partial [Tanacetum coccineum]